MKRLAKKRSGLVCYALIRVPNWEIFPQPLIGNVIPCQERQKPENLYLSCAQRTKTICLLTIKHREYLEVNGYIPLQ